MVWRSGQHTPPPQEFPGVPPPSLHLFINTMRIVQITVWKVIYFVFRNRSGQLLILSETVSGLLFQCKINTFAWNHSVCTFWNSQHGFSIFRHCSFVISMRNLLACLHDHARYGWIARSEIQHEFEKVLTFVHFFSSLTYDYHYLMKKSLNIKRALYN